MEYLEVQTGQVWLRVELDEVEAVMRAPVEDPFQLLPSSHAYLHSYNLYTGATQPVEYSVTDYFGDLHQGQEPRLEMNSHKLRSVLLRNPPLLTAGHWIRGRKKIYMVTDGALVCFVSGSWGGGRLLLGYRNLLRMAQAGMAAKEWADEDGEADLSMETQPDQEPIPFDLSGPTGLDSFDDLSANLDMITI